MTHSLTIQDFETNIIRFAVGANAVLGIRESGKTNTGIFLAEQMLECGIPFFALDPLSKWKDMKHAGKGRGYDVVVIGRDGDIVIDEFFIPESIIEIVRKAIASNVSLIFDVFRPRVDDDTMAHIVTLAFQTMFNENNGIRHLFIEEAARFAPQGHIEHKDLYRMIEKVTREGGNCQLGITFINQRAEDLNKQVLGQCGRVFLHRQSGNNSLKTMKKWLSSGVVENADEVLVSMPTLKTGECWILEQASPLPHRVIVPLRNSLDVNRATFTEDHLAKTREVDVNGFLFGVNTMGSVKIEEPTVDFPEIVDPIEIFIEPVAEINTEIDFESLTPAEKQVYRTAAQKSFGNGTVKSLVDNLVKRGFTRLGLTIGAHQVYLESDRDANDFLLIGKEQVEYARLLLWKIGK